MPDNINLCENEECSMEPGNPTCNYTGHETSQKVGSYCVSCFCRTCDRATCTGHEKYGKIKY